MLETEEVDDDFFTPVASTSLANIFGNVSKNNEITENDSLKYIPPKPQSVIPKKKEPVKSTECVFACALIGHEWCNNVYTSRGKLGFALIKIQKSGDHNIVLYDSNKTTLSSTTVSSQLELTIKNKTYISYYDSLQKYWSIYGTEEEIKKIEYLLKSLGANVNYSNHTDKDPAQPKKSEIKSNIPLLDESSQQTETVESDTDSSVNRKTKASILNRMANMGHSVLPTRNLPVERTSDSSDTNEMETQPKSVRHKSIKPYSKKNNIETIVSESQQITEANQRIIVAEPEKNIAVFSPHSQFIPITSTGMMASTSNELSMFMTEQRINSSEMRINLNRITDKVDFVLDKIKHLDHIDKKTNISTDILLKLLTEYENKIKGYEEQLISKGMTGKTKTDNKNQLQNEEVELLKKTVLEIESINTDKCNEICSLQKELQLLKELHSKDKQDQATREKEFTTKIDSLEESLKEKSKELIALSNADPSNVNIQDKVKNIMNDTFQTISMNFEDSDVYTGETIKRTVGTVIKKLTIKMLSELKDN